MLSFEPNIAVIDDKKEEVQGIIDRYNEQGIGCIYFNANPIKGHDMPDKHFSDINLIFLDLIFREGLEGVDHEQCANWITSIVPKRSFYILVIWTKDPGEAEEVISELKRFKCLPFKCIVKNKIDFERESDFKYDFSDLFLQINDELSKTPAISEIGIWKKNIKQASNVVVGNLSKNSTPDFFNTKLQKIIVSHGGASIRKSNDNARKRTVLFEALDQVLVSNTNINLTDPDTFDDNLYSLKSNQKYDIDKELNSWFHFKLQKELDEKLIVPGLICENRHSLFKGLYSLQDDPKLNPKLKKQFESKGTVITDIAVILTRPCDIAQNKFGKNIKLLSGIKISNPIRYTVENLTDKQKEKKKEYLGKLHFNGQNMADSTTIYDHLFFNDEDQDVVLLFDFRYVFSIPEKFFIDKTKFENLKIFNKELLSEMQVEYSSYSSRLGITQII